MFKRNCQLLMLLFAFAFAQLGMLTHEITHYSDVNQVTVDYNQQHKKNTPQETQSPCVTCLAYGGLSSLDTVTPMVFTFDASEQYYFVFDNTQHFTRHFSNSLARAPPVLV